MSNIDRKLFELDRDLYHEAAYNKGACDLISDADFVGKSQKVTGENARDNTDKATADEMQERARYINNLGRYN